MLASEVVFTSLLVFDDHLAFQTLLGFRNLCFCSAIKLKNPYVTFGINHEFDKTGR